MKNAFIVVAAEVLKGLTQGFAVGIGALVALFVFNKLLGG